MFKRKRDSQRQRVYDAERLWRPIALDRGWITTFPTRHELEDYCGKVFQWTAAKRGRVPYQQTRAPRVLVRKGAKQRQHLRSFAYPGLNKIKIGRLDTHSTIHELAHLYAPLGEGHGPLFCVSYLALVTEFMGADAAWQLNECFKALKVRVKPKTQKRKVTPERRAQLIAQLKKARVAKEWAVDKSVRSLDTQDGPAALKSLLRFG